MVDSSLYPALHEAIKQNEIGGASPYVLSYARFGASGASFGIFQGDTNVNDQARAVLRAVLEGAALAAAAIARILTAVCRPLPEGDPLSTADTKSVNDALSSPKGRTAVDAMDDKLFQVVVVHLDACIAAAAGRGFTLDPVGLLYLALWVNMTGAPTTLCEWLAGSTVNGIAAPSGPQVSAAAIEVYLQHTSFFKMHPNNFTHLRQSVDTAIHLLPPA